MRIENALNEYYRNRETKTPEVRRFLQHLESSRSRLSYPQALYRKQSALLREAGRADLSMSFQKLETPEERVAFAHSDLLAA